jgi:hypothetical protein
MVLTLAGTQVSAMTRFDPAVLPRFRLGPGRSMRPNGMGARPAHAMLGPGCNQAT